MLTRLALWTMLATLAIPAHAVAQPKSPITPAINTGAGAQLIPVSFTNDHIAATVNGEKILVGDVRKMLDKRPLPIIPTEAQKRDLRHAALDVLVDDALMRQYLTKQVPQVNQAEFNKEWDDLLKGLEAQKKSLDEFLRESGQSKDQFQRDIVALLQWRTMLTRMLPEEQAKRYYEDNKVFFDKIYVKASHILIKIDAKTTKDQRDKAYQQMLVWRQDILSGKSKFEEIARLYSQCPSKEKDGDIGQFPYKFIVLPEISKAAFNMREGEISDVVQTVTGLHLIKLTERGKGEPSTYEGVRQAVREVWAQDQDLQDRILAEQRKASQIKIELP